MKRSSENEIQKWGRRLKRLTVVLFCLGPVLFTLLLYLGKFDALLRLPENIRITANSLSISDWVIIALLGAIRPAAFLPVFWALYKLSNAYENGKVFSLENTRCIRLCGMALIGIDIAAVLQSMLTGPVLGLAGITPRYFVIQLGISYSIVGVFLYLISKIMQLAQSIKEEQDLTI